MGRSVREEEGSQAADNAGPLGSERRGWRRAARAAEKKERAGPVAKEFGSKEKRKRSGREKEFGLKENMVKERFLTFRN